MAESPERAGFARRYGFETYAELLDASEELVKRDSPDWPRCYDCWLLLIKSGQELRVGAFEYEACE